MWCRYVACTMFSEKRAESNWRSYKVLHIRWPVTATRKKTNPSRIIFQTCNTPLHVSDEICSKCGVARLKYFAGVCYTFKYFFAPVPYSFPLLAHRVHFKVLLYVYRGLQGRAPDCLADLVHAALPSCSCSAFCMVPIA